jgi:hypothetical protein
LVLLSTAVFTSLYAEAGHRSSVLAIAHDVPQGQRLTEADLSVVSVSASPGLHTVSAAGAHQIVGKRAAVPLVAGTLLNSAEIESAAPLPRGDAIVGVEVGQGQLPADGVVAGEKVDITFTAPAGALASTTSGELGSSDPVGNTATVALGGVLASDVIVSAVTTANSSGSPSTIVSVIVPSDLAPLIASASAAGQAAVILVGGA